MMFFTEYDVFKPEFETIIGKAITEENQALYLSWLSVKLASQGLKEIKELKEILTQANDKK